MAATIAKAHGYGPNKTSSTSRLGHRAASAEAKTWKTFAQIHINQDGSGYFELKRDGKIVTTFDWEPE